MKTHQFNTRIEEKAFQALEHLAETLHTTKGHLAEKAIYLLKNYFDELEKSIGKDKSPDIFLTLLGKSTEQYGDVYQKLAKSR